MSIDPEVVELTADVVTIFVSTGESQQLALKCV